MTAQEAVWDFMKYAGMPVTLPEIRAWARQRKDTHSESHTTEAIMEGLTNLIRQGRVKIVLPSERSFTVHFDKDNPHGES